MTGPPRLTGFQSAYLLGQTVTAFALADFVGPLLVDLTQSPSLMGLLFGGLAGQLGLLVIWSVLGPQRWFVRLAVTFAVTLLLVSAVCSGVFIVGEYTPPAGEFICLLFCLPLAFLGVQLPLWVWRIAGGWRIVRADAEPAGSTTAARQFRLQDALAAMSLLAVAFGLASLGLAGAEGGDNPWMPFLSFCMFCSVWSAISTLPCLWACFAARRKRRSAVLIGVYVVVITAILGVVVNSFVRSALPPEMVVTFFLFHAGLLGLMLGVLHVLRICGYVLHRAGRKRSKTPPREGPPDPDRDGPVSPFEPSGPE